MANKNYDNEDGVWRTIGGRRVFIRTGQSLADAMKESGKFSRVAKNQELYKKVDEENKKINELVKKEEKKKDISSEDAIDEFMGADVGDWNNMNQAERDKTCENILKDFEKKYGDKLEDEKFRKEVLDGLEDQNFHTMGKIIDKKYEYSNNKELKDLDNRIAKAEQKKQETYPKAQGGTKFEDLDLNIEEKEAFSNYLRNKYGTDDFRIINFDNKENAKKIYDEFKETQRETKELMDDLSVDKGYWEKIDENTSRHYNRSELRKKYGTDDVELINAGKAKEDRVSLKEEKKTIHTASGDYTYEEMQKRDKEVKDLYKSNWNNEISAKELNDKLEKMREEGRLSYGEQSALQYDASMEFDRELEKKKETEKPKKEDTFVQKSTNPFYPDREYSKDELKKMEEAGVKPKQNSYSGSGWEGVNAHKNLSTSEQAKAITDAMKKKYPDVKIARKSDVFSGGSSIDFNIMSSDRDIFISDAEIDKREDFGRLSTGYEFERWAEKNVEGFKRYTHEQYTTNDVRKFAKEQLANMKTRDIQNVKGDEWYLSDYGKKVVSDLNKEANSYTFDDSDAMTDYFSHGTYMDISIGKWNKPYEVKGNSVTSALKNKAYQKYMKEHPGSKMTLTDFKKSQK